MVIATRQNRKSNFQMHDEIGPRFTVKITPSAGIVARSDALQILKQSLTGSMLYSTRDISHSYFAILYNRRSKPVTAAVLHIDFFKKLATISLFATDTRWQKRGLGTMLNTYIIEQCERRNMKLCVQASPFAIDWWKSRGFRDMRPDELCYYGIKGTHSSKCGKRTLGGKNKDEIEFDVLIFDETRRAPRKARAGCSRRRPRKCTKFSCSVGKKKKQRIRVRKRKRRK